MAEHVYFFWDYAHTDEEIRKILQGDNEVEKVWVISRILQVARWEDIWKYVTLSDIRQHLDRLQFRNPHLHELWRHALTIWSQPDE